MESTVDFSEVYRKLNEIEQSMVTKKELAEAVETMGILSNEDTMNQIRSSEEDFENGNFNEINSLEDL